MTETQLDRMRAFAIRGRTGPQIAADMDLPYHQVARALRRMREAGELPPIGNPVTADEIAAVRTAWRDGMPIVAIAKTIGRPVGTVATITARLRASGEIGLRTGPRRATSETAASIDCGGVSPPTL
jgi:hypothetical protein